MLSEVFGVAGTEQSLYGANIIMAVEGVLYSLDVVKDLSDDDLYQKLYETWGLTEKKSMFGVNLA